MGLWRGREAPRCSADTEVSSASWHTTVPTSGLPLEDGASRGDQLFGGGEKRLSPLEKNALNWGGSGTPTWAEECVGARVKWHERRGKEKVREERSENELVSDRLLTVPAREKVNTLLSPVCVCVCLCVPSVCVCVCVCDQSELLCSMKPRRAEVSSGCSSACACRDSLGGGGGGGGSRAQTCSQGKHSPPGTGSQRLPVCSSISLLGSFLRRAVLFLKDWHQYKYSEAPSCWQSFFSARWDVLSFPETSSNFSKVCRTRVTAAVRARGGLKQLEPEHSLFIIILFV